jgi:hypothetical protein
MPLLPRWRAHHNGRDPKEAARVVRCEVFNISRRRPCLDFGALRGRRRGRRALAGSTVGRMRALDGGERSWSETCGQGERRARRARGGSDEQGGGNSAAAATSKGGESTAETMNRGGERHLRPVQVEESTATSAKSTAGSDRAVP